MWLWPAVCPAGTGAPGDMFPCHAHPLPGLIPVTSEALHPRMMKGEQQRVKKGQRWGSLRLGETCTHAQAHRPQRRPPALALATSHSRTFNKSLNSLGGEHPTVLHSRLRSWGPMRRCTSWKQEGAMPAQRGRLCLRSGSSGHHQSKMRSLHPGINCSQKKKKKKFGGGVGCAFGSIC